MQVTVLENNKSRFVFEVEGASHTMCNALKEELWADDSVKVAGYTVDHPLVGKPKFVLEMKRGDAKKAVLAAVQRLDRAFDDLGKQAAKELK